jgi:hypothetical protein
MNKDKKIGRLLAAVEERDRTIAEQKEDIVGLRVQVRGLGEQIETMKANWRPIPIVHEWQPRNPQCVYCDDPREAVRHQRPPGGWPDETEPTD